MIRISACMCTHSRGMINILFIMWHFSSIWLALHNFMHGDKEVWPFWPDLISISSVGGSLYETTYVNASSRNALLVTHAKFYPPKFGIGTKYVSEDLETSHFSNFQAFHSGDHMTFIAFSCFSGNFPHSMWLILRFYLMRSHMHMEAMLFNVVWLCGEWNVLASWL